MATSGEFYSPFKGRFEPSDDTAEIGSAAHPVKALTVGTVTASGAVTVGGTLGVTGAITATGGVTGDVTGSATTLPTTAGPTSGALSVAMSGRLCIGVVDAVYTLPAPTAGVWYTIWTGVASAGTGLTITATSTLIQGKTSPTGTVLADKTNLINSGASDAAGDFVTIRSDGTKWYVVAQSGTYAGT